MVWRRLRARDAALLKRAAAILRHFAPTLLRTKLFEPYYTSFTLNATAPPPPDTIAVSKFANASAQRALYLLVSTAADGQLTTLHLEVPRALPYEW